MEWPDRSLSARLFDEGIEVGSLRLKIASTEAEKKEVFRLRYRVFNEELGEGIPENAQTQMDQDSFDEICDHLMICSEERIIGTYRLLNGKQRPSCGFYSETEFRLDSLGIDFSKAAEIGRGCIDPAHRNRSSLITLFEGFHHYLNFHSLHYLFGCSSLPIMSYADVQTTFEHLNEQGHFVETPGVEPLPTHRFEKPLEKGSVNVPPLLSVYLGFGAKIYAQPAWDPIFGCCDLLTLLDARELTPWGRALMRRFYARASKSSRSQAVG